MKLKLFLLSLFVCSCLASKGYRDLSFKPKEENFNKQLKNFKELVVSPKILIASAEWGPGIEFADGTKSPSHQAGGLGTVVDDWMSEIPKYLASLPASSTTAEASFVFMGNQDYARGEQFAEFDIKMGKNLEKVQAFKAKHQSGAAIFFLKNSSFARKSLGSPYTYVSQERKTKYTDLESFYDYVLFSKSIAELSKLIGATVLHLNDYHTALAAYYASDISSSLISIHNGGPFYQGIVNADGDFEKISYLLELAGIPYKDFTKFFKIGSLDFCLLNTLKFTANKFLLGGVAVSPNYAQELLLSKEEIEKRLEVQKNKRKAKRPANVYIFSGAMKFPYIVGIINGLSDKSHARENVYLRRYNGDNVANNDLLEPALLKKYWENDLNFDAKDMAGVSTNKAILKHIVQEHYRLDISPHKPLFSLVSRIVGQKNIGIFVRVIERIVAHGGQVVIAGPGSAPDVNSRLELVAEKHKTSVFFRKGFIGGREKIAVQAGADFTVITSLYEPAGLTDIEAAWLGTIPIAKRTGGLGKVTSGYYYEWLDNTALDDEADELWKVVQVALQDYRNGKSLSKAEAGLLERFDWQTSIRDYHDLYGVAATYKIIQWIDQNAINEVHKKQLIAQLIAVNSDPLYIKRVCFHLKAAKKILNASEALYIKSAG